MQKINIKITNVAGFFKFFQMLNGGAGGSTVIDYAMAGDFSAALDAFAANAQYAIGDGTGELIATLVRLGLIKLVSNAASLDRAFTLGNITIGV